MPALPDDGKQAPLLITVHVRRREPVQVISVGIVVAWIMGLVLLVLALGLRPVTTVVQENGIPAPEAAAGETVSARPHGGSAE